MLRPWVLKEKARKLKRNLQDAGRVSLEHPAGQTGVHRPISQGFPVVYYRRTTVFAGTPAAARVFADHLHLEEELLSDVHVVHGGWQKLPLDGLPKHPTTSTEVQEGL